MNTENLYLNQKLNPKELRFFFLSHLNRLFCAKSQLIEKLPELKKHSQFEDLRLAIDETVEVVANQITRMKEIYIKLDAIFQPENCTGLVGILDETFQAIGNPGENPAFKDLSIIFYMLNIESIEIASFKMMLLVAEQINDKEVVQLLMECYDEAKEDKILFSQITSVYFH